jgi:hypothetical protein
MMTGAICVFRFINELHTYKARAVSFPVGLYINLNKLHKMLVVLG